VVAGKAPGDASGMAKTWLRSALVGYGVLAGCGGAAVPSRPAVAPSPNAPSSLRFVRPPLVVSAGDSGTVAVWVRLDRPLRDSDGAPQEYRGFNAYLEVPHTTADIPGLYRDDSRPTCFGQELVGSVEDGQRVRVALVLGDGRRLTATTRAQVWESGDDVDRRARARLGCPPSPDAGHERRCGGTVTGRHLTFSLGLSAFVSCGTARQVMRSVGRWANSLRCYERLCVTGHRMNLDFRCDAELVGEAAWAITCRDGRRVVRGYTAE
jgi:hypothetical protein